MSPLQTNPETLLGRLEWTVVRKLDGLLNGDYRTLFRGFGLDLADLREYQVEDDVRYIDWNVTARMQTPYVREYNEEREITAWFLLDLTPSIDFGSAQAQKREMLIEFVTILASLISRRGNRVGAMFYGGKIDRIVPARGGRTHLLYLLNTLLRAPHLQSSPPTSLGDLLQSAYRFIKRRSLVFIVSDFYSEPGWARPLGQLAQRHEVLAVRVFDPMEMELPDIGLVLMSDSESGEQVLLDTHNRKFRVRFAEAARLHEGSLRLALTEAGVDGIELSTRDDLVETIIRYATLHKRQKAARGGAMVGRQI